MRIETFILTVLTLMELPIIIKTVDGLYFGVKELHASRGFLPPIKPKIIAAFHQFIQNGL